MIRFWLWPGGRRPNAVAVALLTATLDARDTEIARLRDGILKLGAAHARQLAAARSLIPPPYAQLLDRIDELEVRLAIAEHSEHSDEPTVALAVGAR